MKLNMMLFFPSFNLKAILWIAQAFLLILSISVHTTQAGVIKKRDLNALESTTIHNLLSQNDGDLRETQVAPTILTAVKEAAAQDEEEGEMVSTKLKLQPVGGNTIAQQTAGTSKELSYNEISLNEAKKQQLTNTNLNTSFFKETKLKSETEESGLEHDSTTENIKITTTTEFTSNIVLHENEQKNVEINAQKLDNKLEDLSALIITTTEHSPSNTIQEEHFNTNSQQENEVKVETSKLANRFKQLEVEEDEQHIVNSLKYLKDKPSPPSRILPELKIEDEKEEMTTASKIENDIHSEMTTQTPLTTTGVHHNEHIEDQLMQETTERKLSGVTEVSAEHNQDKQNQIEDQQITKTNREEEGRSLMKSLKTDTIESSTITPPKPSEEHQTTITNNETNKEEESLTHTNTLETVANDPKRESSKIAAHNVLETITSGPVYKPEEEEDKLKMSTLKPVEQNAQNPFSSGPVYKPEQETNQKSTETAPRSEEQNVEKSFPAGPVYKPEHDISEKSSEKTSRSEEQHVQNLFTSGPIYKPEEGIITTTTAAPIYKPEDETSVKSASEPTYKPEEEAITKSTPIYKPEEEPNVKKASEISSNSGVSASHEEHSNSIQDGLDREELSKAVNLKNLPPTTTEQPKETTSATTNNVEISGLLDGNKKEYARSMFTDNEEELKGNEKDLGNLSLKESTTTLTTRTDNEILLTTTSKPGNLAESIETTETLKEFEKKPKFINDNSANAQQQQLNLPNNAEVWSLAAMKTLPKANVTIDTAQKHNISQEIKEENLQNHTTFTVTSNSEKNLLDWSLIMKDKELATTARNQKLQQHQENQEEYEEKSGNQLTNEEEKLSSTAKEELEQGKHPELKEINIITSTTTTTVSPEQTLTQPSIQSREDDIAKLDSYIEQKEDILNKTITTNTNNILSNTDNNDDNANNNEQDKTITLTMNKQPATTLTSLTAQETQSTTNNPLEINLNEINLTSNQKHDDELNPTTTTSSTGKPNVVDVNSAVAFERAYNETTEATAGAGAVDMTTTLEQNSIELTTFSSLETGKQNASQFSTKNNNNNNNKDDIQQNNNVISEELEKTGREALEGDNKFDNITPTTTTEIAITTYRPKNLATSITNSTATSESPPSIQQEVDQNGNVQITEKTETGSGEEQKQSITVLEGSNNNNNNITSTAAIETHLSELLETTTLETILANNEKTNIENIENTTTTKTLETTTSSSKDKILKINEQTKIQNLEATPKNKTEDNNETNKEDDTEITTIGSPVIETKFEKEKQEIETTTTTPVDLPVKNESSTPAADVKEDKIESRTDKEAEEGGGEEGVTTQKSVDNQDELATTMASYAINKTTTTKAEDEETLIKLLDDTTTTTTTTTQPPDFTPATEIPLIASTTLSSVSASSETTTTTTSTTPLPITTKIEEIYKVIHTTTTEAIQTTSTSSTSQYITDGITTEDDIYTYSSPTNDMLPITSTPSFKMIETADIGKSLPTLTTIMGGNSGNMYPKNSEATGETDVNVIIAITVSVIGVVALILLVGFLYLMRKRQKQTSYSQRCRPVSLDEYTIDNVSVGGSMRKTSVLRSSKRTYGNLAFDDPSLRHNAMGVHELAKFAPEKLRIFEEFRDVPQVTARLDEVPQGCEDKNRYANVLPLPETRVILQRLNDDDKTEYINANYVTGPKDAPNYYIACQAPLDTTVEDFWRMIWEQQSRVIIQATDLIENGVEKCAEYLPPSVTLDNHSTFGDFQITLQNREVKDKYAISTILLKHVAENATRELTHYWYKWPEVGVPAEEAPIIAMLLEARSSLISYAIEQANEDKEKSSMATLKAAEEGVGASANGGTAASPSKDSNGSSSANGGGEINGNISMVHIKKTARNQGPLTIHCSPGTGRTGTIIACDIAIRSLETPKRIVDVPQIVYYVRRGRASAVLTKEQYEFIYKVANMYAAKISNPTNYN